MTSRRSVVAFAAAFVSLLPLLASAAPARQAEPVTLKHVPPGTAVRDVELVFRANIAASEGVFLPTLFYRTAGDTRFYSLPMLPVPGSIDIYVASVPAIFVTKQLEYYLEAYDRQLRGPGRVGSPTSPLSVTVVEPTVPPSQVVVRSEPSAAEVVLDGKSVGETPWLGIVPAGLHELLLKKTGFLEVVSTLDVPENRDLEIVRSLPPEAERALFAVSSDPMGASVFIDGQPLGDTPLIGPNPDGKYTLTVRKPGHARAERTLIFTRDRSVETSFSLVKLPPEPALAITTDPPGAEVSVDGQSLGKTPFIGVVPAGEHTLFLTLGGRRITQAQILMPEERDLDLRFAMAEDTVDRAPVLAVSSDPVGASIFVDGVELAQKTPYIGTLSPGPHRVMLAHEGFHSYERTIEMPETNDIELTIGLVALPPPPGPSKIVIDTEQPDVAIIVNGKDVGQTPATIELDAGDHVAVAKKDGFRTLEERFTVSQGESMKMRLALSAVEKGVEEPLLSVRTEPEGAIITVDGRVMEQRSPFSHAFAPGKHVVTVSREGFKVREETFDLPDDRAFELRYAFVLEPLRRTVALESAAQALEPKQKTPIVDADEVRSGDKIGQRISGATDVFGLSGSNAGMLARPVAKERNVLGPAILAGSGVVIAGIGALFVVKSMGTAADIANPMLEFDRDAIVSRHDREITAGVGLMAAGVAFTAAGVVWALVSNSPGDAPAGAGSDVDSVGVVPLDGGAMLSVGGRF